MRDDFLKYTSAFLLLVILIFVVVSTVTDKAVLLEPFQVPPKLKETGYDGRAIAFAVIDQMNLIRSNARTASGQNYIPVSEQMDVVVGGISLSSVRALMKEISGLKNLRVTGEIAFLSNGSWSVSTRFDGLSSQPLRHSSSEIENILKNIAIYILWHIEPLTVAVYQANQNDGGVMKSIRDILRNKSLSPRDHALAYNLWGLRLIREQRYDQAIRQYESAVKKDPNGAYVYTNWGNALHRWGQATGDTDKLNKAGQMFEKASRIKPDLAANYINWGMLLLAQKEYVEAEKTFRRAGAVDSTFENLAMLSVAEVYGRQNRYEEQIKIVSDLVELYPEYRTPYGVAYHNWGVDLNEKGKYIEAIAKFEKSAEINPQFARTYLDWGLSLYHIEKFPEAITKFQKVIELEPTNEQAYFNWGQALRAMNNMPEAANKFKTVTELNPKDALAFVTWGAALVTMGKFEQGIDKYKHALNLNPKLAEAYFWWGLSLLDQNQNQEAISKFAATLREAPKHKDAHYFLGVAHKKLKQEKEAKTHLSKYLELAPAGGYAKEAKNYLAELK